MMSPMWKETAEKNEERNKGRGEKGEGKEGSGSVNELGQ